MTAVLHPAHSVTVREDAGPAAWTRPLGPVEPSARVLVLAALALTLIGTIAVFSASAFGPDGDAFDRSAFLRKHVFHVVLGAVVMGLGMRMDLSRLRRLARPLLIVVTCMLVLVLLPGIREKVNGAYRWLRVGPLSFQPSEPAKLALVLYLAHLLTARAGRARDWLRSTIPAVVPVAVICFLVLVEPDFGTAVFLGAVGVAVMLVGGVPVPRLAYLACLASPVLAWQAAARWELFMRRFAAVGGERIASDPATYQVDQGLIGLGSGGLFGRGLGAGWQKLFVPEGRTDFILPIIGEELGFVGTGLVVLLFIVLVLAGLRVAMAAARRYRFGFLLAFGLVFWIGLQAAGNIAVVTASVPTKGIALPFVSFGGSSLLVLCFAVGLVYAVARRVDALARGEQSPVWGTPPNRVPSTHAMGAAS